MAEPSLSTSAPSPSGRKRWGPDHPDVATSLNNLAELYDSKGEYGRAEPLYQRALAIFEKALGPDHPDVASSLNNLAELYQAKGEYDRAEPLYQRALAISGKSAGAGPSGGGHHPQQPRSVV